MIKTEVGTMMVPARKLENYEPREGEFRTSITLEFNNESSQPYYYDSGFGYQYLPASEHGDAGRVIVKVTTRVHVDPIEVGNSSNFGSLQTHRGMAAHEGITPNIEYPYNFGGALVNSYYLEIKVDEFNKSPNEEIILGNLNGRFVKTETRQIGQHKVAESWKGTGERWFWAIAYWRYVEQVREYIDAKHGNFTSWFIAGTSEDIRRKKEYWTNVGGHPVSIPVVQEPVASKRGLWQVIIDSQGNTEAVLVTQDIQSLMFNSANINGRNPVHLFTCQEDAAVLGGPDAIVDKIEEDVGLKKKILDEQLAQMRNASQASEMEYKNQSAAYEAETTRETRDYNREKAAHEKEAQKNKAKTEFLKTIAAVVGSIFGIISLAVSMFKKA